jgi:hypothetical protein
MMPLSIAKKIQLLLQELKMAFTLRGALKFTSTSLIFLLIVHYTRYILIFLKTYKNK